MTKISKRNVRALRREMRFTRNQASECARNRREMTKRMIQQQKAHNCHTSQLQKRNSVLEMNVRELEMNVRKLNKESLKQQIVIQQQQCALLENGKRNPCLATIPSPHTMDCAKAMIAMSQGVCRDCLGARTILKTKKNIRYNVECKSCVNEEHSKIIHE